MKYDFLSNSLFFLILYLLAINIYGFAIMGIDKWKSKKRRWRTPEYTFFIVAFIGGATGTYAGMRVFHHKTLHKKFKIGIPIIILINLFFIYYMLKG